ncbi:MAG: UbiA prenyltransferase family protein [Chloroflexota bacterium]|nr:UbiA prenyltransferase family protein [Chloroflexota bacterium]
MGSLLRAMRPRQWAKNGIIYFALVFSINQRWEFSMWREGLELFAIATAAFLLWCLVSSATYLVNDLLDAPRDRLHPRKRHRPIAAGLLSERAARTAAAVMFAVGLGLSFLLQPWFGVTALIYLALTLAYSLLLKRVPVADILSLGSVYVLRAVAGAVVIQVPISPWLYAVMGLGAMMIVLGKRRGELVTAAAAGDAEQQRAVLGAYSPRLLDALIRLSAAGVLAAYVAYTLTAAGLPDNMAMALTLPFAVFGLYRYLRLLYRDGASGETPEEMFLSDRPLQVAAVLGLVTVLTVLSLGR